MRQGLEALRDLAAEGQIAMTLDLLKPDRAEPKVCLSGLTAERKTIALRSGVDPILKCTGGSHAWRISCWCSFRAS